jgi:peptidyl-dipeptidase Dcp
MNRPHIMLVAAASVAVANIAIAAPTAPGNKLEASNPFARESSLPFNYPAWDKIRNEHFAPAYAEGMRQQAAEMEAIANNKAAPTFDNTIVAMEKSGRLLNRVSGAFGTLSGSYTNDTLIALGKEMAPKLSQHGDAIRLNDKLFKRIETLYNKRASLKLDAESTYLLERYYDDFVRAGAKLSAAD